MLRIYSDILDWLRELAALIEQIRRHSPNFAAQLERAGQAVLLNTAEGMDARGRNKRRALQRGAV